MFEQGPIAVDSPISTVKPVLIGGRGSTATPGVVSADNDVVHAWYSLTGSQHTTVDNTSIAGTAGSANAGVLSVQGIASMTPVQVTVPADTVTGGIQWSHVSAWYTAAQTSADIVALSGTTKFYIGRITVTSNFNTSQAGRTTVQVYFGTGAVADSSKHLFRGTFITVPGTGLESYPGAIIGDGGAPFIISAAGDALKITTTTSGTHCGIAVSIDYIRV